MTTAPETHNENTVESRIFTKAKALLLELKDILETETTALKASNIRKAIECQDKKIRLVQQYENLMQQAKAAQEQLKLANTPLKDEVLSLQKDLNAAADDNKRALGNSKKAIERLTNRMMETIRSCVQKQENMAYSASGTMDNTGRSLSINIDETL